MKKILLLIMLLGLLSCGYEVGIKKLDKLEIDLSGNINKDEENHSLLLGSNVNLDLDKCSEQDEYFACYSDLSEMKQYLFLKDSFKNMKNHNLLESDTVLTINNAKVFFTDIYKNHEEKGLSVISQEEYIGKYYDKVIIVSKRTYPHGLSRYMFLSKESANTGINKANEIYKNTDRIEKDTSVLSDIKYEEVGNYIKVSGMKYSNYKKYNKPFYIIIGYIGDEIKIIEEFNETTP